VPTSWGNHHADIQNILGSVRMVYGWDISPLQIMFQVQFFVQKISRLKFVKLAVKNLKISR
jgi:hypothetical protein